MIKHINRILYEKFKTKTKYQEELEKAYKSIDREAMNTILIELMDLAEMHTTNPEANPSNYALGFREGKRALVKHILRNLDLDEIKFFSGLGKTTDK